MLGWKRSTYDGIVLTDVVANHRLSILEKKYHFEGAGYCNSDYVMISYQNVWYYSLRVKFDKT